MPLYKNKGSRYDPNNHRGITLLSCLGKLFTACLNARISKFMYENEIIGFEQAGFRPEFSTMDHIFTLHAIIEYYKCKKGRVYCAFIDYSKAFDLIDRASLWIKLLNHGVNGKILSVIQNIYNKAKSSVKINDKISNFFSCNIGVRQGENLSPILFAIYLNDFQSSMCKSYQGLNELSCDVENELETFMKLYVLLYADDTVVLAESANELQLALNELNEYCQKWSLAVNVHKTKIVIFSRGKVRKYPRFTLGSNEIEVKDDYVYLGVTFNYNGSFKKAISKQISQGRKAMFALVEKAKILRLPTDIVLELFETCVVPVLLYGAEIWGWENLNDIDIFHRNFLRNLLKTFKFTPNCMLYGETGSFNMSTKIKTRMINFWLNLKFGNPGKVSAILCRLTSKLHTDKHDTFHFKWVETVKSTLENTGFSTIWENQYIDVTKFKSCFVQRCKDIFQQKWLEEVSNNSQCTFYREVKDSFNMEDYLVNLESCHKYNLIKFRTRTHHLPITKQRFHDTSADITCPLCSSNEVGDESHYLFVCDFFKAQRDKYIPVCLQRLPHTTVFKNLFTKSETITNVARFAKIIMSKFKFRKSEIVNSPCKKQITTCSGRVVKQPVRLSL